MEPSAEQRVAEGCLCRIHILCEDRSAIKRWDLADGFQTEYRPPLIIQKAPFPSALGDRWPRQQDRYARELAGKSGVPKLANTADAAMLHLGLTATAVFDTLLADKRRKATDTTALSAMAQAFQDKQRGVQFGGPTRGYLPISQSCL